MTLIRSRKTAKAVSFFLATLPVASFALAVAWGQNPVQKIKPAVVRIPKDPPVVPGIAPLGLELDLVIGNQPSDENALFSELIALQVSPDGTIYALDRKEVKLKIFDASGRFLRAVGKRGQGPMEWQGPTSLFFGKDGVVVVGDFINNRISRLSSAGEFGEESPMGKWRSSVIRTDERGRILLSVNITEPERRLLQIHRFDSSMQWIEMVVTFEEKRTPPPHLNPYPETLRFNVLPNDDVIWGYTGAYEFHIIGPDGTERAVIRKEHDRVKVTEAERDETRKEFARPGVPPDLKLDFPEHHSAFWNFVVDEKGRLYVTTSEHDSEGRTRIDVFDPDGGSFKKIFPPRGNRLAAVRDGMFYFIENENDEGVPVIKRYRLK